MKKIGATGTWGRVELSSEATEGQRIYVEPPRDVMGVILVYGCDRIETVHPGQKAVFKARSAPKEIRTMIRAIRGRRRVSWSGIGQHDRQVTHGYDEQAAACPMGEGAWARCASSHPRRRPELAEGRGDPVATAAIRAALPGARICCRGGSSLRAVAFPRSRRAAPAGRPLQARTVRRLRRPRQGSKWGNPFTWKQGTLAEFVVPMDEVLTRYKAWVLSQPDLVDRIKRELRGKRLGCWCAPKACHGDILAAIANGDGASLA